MQKRSSLSNIGGLSRLESDTSICNSSRNIDTTSLRSGSRSGSLRNDGARLPLSDKKGLQVSSLYIQNTSDANTRDVNIYNGYKERLKKVANKVPDETDDFMDLAATTTRQNKDSMYNRSLYIKDTRKQKSNKNLVIEELVTERSAHENREVHRPEDDTIQDNPSVLTLKRSSLMNFSSILKTANGGRVARLSQLAGREDTSDFGSPSLSKKTVIGLQRQLKDSVSLFLNSEENRRKTGTINLNVNFNVEISECEARLSTNNPKTGIQQIESLRTGPRPKLSLQKRYDLGLDSPFIKKPKANKLSEQSGLQILSNSMISGSRLSRQVEESNYYVSTMVKTLKSKLSSGGRQDGYFTELYYTHFKTTHMHLAELNRYEKTKKGQDALEPSSKIKLLPNLSKPHLLLDLDETLIHCSTKKSNHEAIQVKSKAYNYVVSL